MALPSNPHYLQTKRKCLPSPYHTTQWSDQTLQLKCACSLYLTNLPEKLRKPDLRLSLYTLFSTYGPVLDVVAMPGNKMRGQAWVAFRDIPTSTQAMRALQGFEFFGRQMVGLNPASSV